MMWIIIGTTIDITKSEWTVNGTGGMKRTINLSKIISYWCNGIGWSSRTFAPMRRATRRPVMWARLRGPSAGPVWIQDSRTLNHLNLIYNSNIIGHALSNHKNIILMFINVITFNDGCFYFLFLLYNVIYKNNPLDHRHDRPTVHWGCVLQLKRFRAHTGARSLLGYRFRLQYIERELSSPWFFFHLHIRAPKIFTWPSST